jgi:hypothetical protein
MVKKLFHTRTDFLRHFFAKYGLQGNLWRNLLMQDLCTFLKSAQKCASFDALCGQFGEKNSTLIRCGGTFWRIKGQVR